MINSLEAYRNAGKGAAKARREHDESRAQFHQSWHNRARRLENKDDRLMADLAFRNAYVEESGFEGR